MGSKKTSIEDCSLSSIWLSKSSSSIHREDVGRKGTIDIGFEITLEGKNKDSDGGHLHLTLTSTATGHGEDKEVTAFELSISVTGLFILSDGFSFSEEKAKKLRPMLAPLIFPYTREYMGDLMRKMGLGHILLPLTLPPMPDEEA